MVFSLFLACQPMPSTGNPLAPAPAPSAPGPASSTGSAGSSGTDAVASEGGGFDFDSDAKEIEDTELPDDPVAILAAQQGLEAPPPAPAQPAPPAYVDPGEQEELAIPAQFAPDSSVDWGLRLVSTVHNVDPPRAILGLPDGTETIVTAGAMLPEINAVVMAVGRQQIDIAYISPAGYQARVETRRITALFPE